MEAPKCSTIKMIITFTNFPLIDRGGVVDLVSLSFTPVTKANTPKALPMTISSLCGKLVFLTKEKTGTTRLGLRSCTNADMVNV